MRFVILNSVEKRACPCVTASAQEPLPHAVALFGATGPEVLPVEEIQLTKFYLGKIGIILLRSIFRIFPAHFLQTVFLYFFIYGKK